MLTTCSVTVSRLYSSSDRIKRLARPPRLPRRARRTGLASTSKGCTRPCLLGSITIRPRLTRKGLGTSSRELLLITLAVGERRA
jgi:hypothetical protein